jgi:hypothetical protein
MKIQIPSYDISLKDLVASYFTKTRPQIKSVKSEVKIIKFRFFIYFKTDYH